MTDISAFFVPLLASAFGGGIVAGAFSIYNRVAGKTDEHQQWLRDRKVEAYTEYLNRCDALLYSVSAFWSGRGTSEELTKAFGLSQSSLEILAHPTVAERAAEIGDFTKDLTHQILKNPRLENAAFEAEVQKYQALRVLFVGDMQRDLSISYPDNPVSGSQLQNS